MIVSLGNLLDRYSIEQRKAFYGAGDEKLIEEIEAELTERISSSIRRMASKDLMVIVRAAMLLGIRNADIANLEWQLRAKKPITAEEAGIRALKIREINDGRNEAKATVDKWFGQTPEAKHYGYGDLPGDKVTHEVQEPAEEFSDKAIAELERRMGFIYSSSERRIHFDHLRQEPGKYGFDCKICCDHTHAQAQDLQGRKVPA
jgi:hypothetical protein